MISMTRPEIRGRRSSSWMPRRIRQSRSWLGPTVLSSQAQSQPKDGPPWLTSTPWVGRPFVRKRVSTKSAALATGSREAEYATKLSTYSVGTEPLAAGGAGLPRPRPDRRQTFVGSLESTAVLEFLDGADLFRLGAADSGLVSRTEAFARGACRRRHWLCGVGQTALSPDERADLDIDLSPREAV